MTGKLLIAIPMKDPKQAKTRLSEALPPQERQRFALSLFLRTLDQIAAAQCDASVVVVTASSLIAEEAQARGAAVLMEEAAQGLNSACAQAKLWAAEQGFVHLAILPGDLALLSAADIAQLSRLVLPPTAAALCESSDGGTNCLMLHPEAEFAFCFGPGSFRAHRKAAARAGLACHILRSSTLRFDVDTTRDLAQIQQLRQRPSTGQQAL
ncbi:2-phospho-L-lactate guanylyltransferase [Shimia sp.]|uniref:2-phospho-L-lactate guanylyltransferase n=1 Tax=Shimia sp. TaxID=1954381 RepID=UPI003BAA5E48